MRGQLHRLTTRWPSGRQLQGHRMSGAAVKRRVPRHAPALKPRRWPCNCALRSSSSSPAPCKPWAAIGHLLRAGSPPPMPHPPPATALRASVAAGAAFRGGFRRGGRLRSVSGRCRGHCATAAALPPQIHVRRSPPCKATMRGASRSKRQRRSVWKGRTGRERQPQQFVAVRESTTT